MPGTSTLPPERQRRLLAAARAGDEGAYRSLVEPHEGELKAHCYRMLGSVHDAEDALQDAMLKAWKGLPRFEGRSSLRSWLYAIATNACLDSIGKRPKRVLPVDYAPASDPHQGPGAPVIERVWVEPLADETLEIEDGYASPDARYEQRESVELAFIAALQLLPPNQRAALIMREVLGFSAKEVAAALDTTVAAVNSALQRARATVGDRLPERSQQETLRSLGDERVRELVEQYAGAWERGDVETVVDMLAAEASFTMPPLSTWFSGRREIEIFLRHSPMSGDWRWRPIRVRANGQEALAFYAWDDELGAFGRFALNVLTFDGERISDVTAFIAHTPPPEDDREVIMRMPEQPEDELMMDAAFERFGLPERLEAGPQAASE